MIEIYAIIETGGKQYKVTPGKVLDVEYLGVAQGATVELDRVLLVGDGEQITVGSPLIAGAKVVTTSQGEKKSRKVVIFKYRNKMRYRKKTGHRQLYTRLIVDKIIGAASGQETSEVKHGA